MKTISTASYKIVIGNSRNCVTPLSIQIESSACYIFISQVQGRLRYVLTHAAKTHLLIIMDTEVMMYDIVSALELM
jgi:hypothetical protein